MRSYPGGKQYTCYTVKQTLDGGFILGGSYNIGDDKTVAYLIKTEPGGDIVWTRKYEGYDKIKDIHQTLDGGYVFTGNTGPYIWLIKTDERGNPLWFKGYGYGYGESVEQTSDGGYLVAGWYPFLPEGQILLLKTDSNGDVVWQHFYGEEGYAKGKDAKQTSDGGYIIVGNRDEKVWLIKTDSNGDTLWIRTYDGAQGLWGESLQQISDGGFIIATMDSYDACLIKTDPNGNVEWKATYGGFSGNYVQETSDGGYIIVGSICDRGSKDVYLIKVDDDGEILWRKIYGEEGMDDVGQSIQGTSDGGYIIAGYNGLPFTEGNDSLLAYMLLLKTDVNGFIEVKKEHEAKYREGEF